MPMPIYVIAFADATDQRQKMADQLTQMQLACAFIDAVDGRAMDAATRAGHISARRQSWIKRQISAGATGCALSHYECWRQLLASDAPCALILEDDAHLEADTPAVLSALATQADKFDIITLHRYKNRPARPFFDLPAAPLQTRRQLASVRYNQIGATAYILSRAAAARLLTEAEPICFEVDIYLNRWWQHGLSNLAIIPPLAREDGRASTIGYQQKEPLYPADSLLHKILRWAHRLQDSAIKRVKFPAHRARIRRRWR